MVETCGTGRRSAPDGRLEYTIGKDEARERPEMSTPVGFRIRSTSTDTSALSVTPFTVSRAQRRIGTGKRTVLESWAFSSREPSSWLPPPARRTPRTRTRRTFESGLTGRGTLRTVRKIDGDDSCLDNGC